MSAISTAAMNRGALGAAASSGTLGTPTPNCPQCTCTPSWLWALMGGGLAWGATIVAPEVFGKKRGRR